VLRELLRVRQQADGKHRRHRHGDAADEEHQNGVKTWAGPSSCV
jgi:hypothetical protein